MDKRGLKTDNSRIQLLFLDQKCLSKMPHFCQKMLRIIPPSFPLHHLQTNFWRSRNFRFGGILLPPSNLRTICVQQSVTVSFNYRNINKSYHHHHQSQSEISIWLAVTPPTLSSSGQSNLLHKKICTKNRKMRRKKTK